MDAFQTVTYKPVYGQGRLLSALYKYVSTSPALWLATLALLAWRASTLLGHWPVAWADDPKTFGGDDAIYMLLGVAAIVQGLVTAVSIVSWPILTVSVWKVSTKSTKIWTASIFILGWILILIDPAAWVVWWFD